MTWGRDAADRILSRTTGATSITYGYTGPGDGPGWIVADGHTYLQVALPGGVLLSTAHTATGPWRRLDLTGTAGGGLGVCDPDGQPLSPDTGLLDTDAVPDTSYGSVDNAWLGKWGKQHEHAGPLALIQMGARPYLPALASSSPSTPSKAAPPTTPSTSTTQRPTADHDAGAARLPDGLVAMGQGLNRPRLHPRPGDAARLRDQPVVELHAPLVRGLKRNGWQGFWR